MNITIETSAFTEAVSWVTKNYDAKNDGSYVGFVMDSDGKGHFSHLSETAYRKVPITASSVEFDDGEQLEVALDGKYLQRLSSTLGKALGNIEISFVGDEVKSLEITSTFGEFTVPVYTKKPVPTPEVTNIGEVSENDFLDGMQRVAKLTESDGNSSLPAITAIDLRLRPEDGKLTIMGTDRFALGEIEFDYNPSPDKAAEEVLTVNEKGVSRSFLIPAAVAATVAPEKGSSDLVALVYDNENEKVGYAFSDGRIALFSMIFGDTLEYSSLLQGALDGVEHSVVVDLGAFKKAVGAVSSLAWDETHIWLDIDSAKKVLTAQDNYKKNSVPTTIDAASGEESLRIQFHRATLGKALNAVASSQINISWGGEERMLKFVLQPVIAEGAIDESTAIVVQPQKS